MSADDMRRRAAHQASVGNYWAGKCLGLLDAIEARDAEIERLTAEVKYLRETCTVIEPFVDNAEPLDWDAGADQ